MKAKTKALALALCAVLLVTGSVLTTLAFLKDSDAVVNTFTIGRVDIALDETEVDEYGDPQGTTRVKANTYKLIPGHSYTKDPTVHFAAGSEASWLFVKVENGLADIEANQTIDAQILANGWTALTGQSGVYYRQAAANSGTAAVDYPVFGSFTLDDEADISDYTNASIKVTAYAIQADGFGTAADAWIEAGK